MFYANHADAVNDGIPFAEELIGIPRTEEITGGIRFAAFAIAGNLLLLCEASIDHCKSLIDQLEPSG